MNSRRTLAHSIRLTNNKTQLLPGSVDQIHRQRRRSRDRHPQGREIIIFRSRRVGDQLQNNRGHNISVGDAMALDSIAERGELKARKNVHGHAGVDGVVKEEADSFMNN